MAVDLPEIPRSVLLVEGDPVLRDLISLALKRGQYQVITTSELPEAVRLVREKRTDLVILNLLLPQANGLDLIVQMKKDGVLDRTPVIVISALGYREIVQQAIEVGACDFLVKPFDMDILVNRVQQTLQRRKGLSDISSET